jgi:putative methionine-R-sulfoxide reductase with GAF domain
MNNLYRKKYNYTSKSPTAPELHAEEDILISNTIHTNDFINTEVTNLNKCGFFLQILIQVSSIKFHENPLSV